jgi:hypothetical protein
MDESMQDVNWLRIAFFLAFCGIIIYLGNRFYPEVKWFFPPAIVIIFGLVFAYGSGKWIIWRSRYYAYQVNVNGCHGSIYGKPEYIRDDSVRKGFVWAVFNLGHSTFPISLRGRLATLIVPADQIHEAGKGFNGVTLVHRTPIGNLPYPVHSFLRHNSDSYNLDVVYFGKYSKEYLDNSGLENDLNSQIESLNYLIGIYQKTIEHDFSHIEEIKVLSGLLAEKKGMVKAIVEKVKGVNDEE